MTDLIIDFERLNELTSNEKDNPSALINGIFVFPELYELAIQTLYYNKVLVSKRELKIDSII